MNQEELDRLDRELEEGVRRSMTRIFREQRKDRVKESLAKMAKAALLFFGIVGAIYMALVLAR